MALFQELYIMDPKQSLWGLAHGIFIIVTRTLTRDSAGRKLQGGATLADRPPSSHCPRIETLSIEQ